MRFPVSGSDVLKGRPVKWSWLLLLTAFFGLSGCGAINNMMYKTTGDVMVGFAEKHTVPYVLSSDDLGMNCAMSEAMTPLLMSFGQVTTNPDELGVMMDLSAGNCEEQHAWKYEFEYMKALREQRPEEAQDAMIVEKRHYIIAAKRYYRAWKHLNAFYGDVGEEGKCPSFDNDQAEFIYMMGLLSGLEALNSEIQSTSDDTGVPQNIAAKVARAAGCLDDDKWWGVPMALRATVWAMLPGSQPQGEDAFQRLAAADKKGEEARVRLADVLHAIAAWNQNKTDMVKDIIRRHAKDERKIPPDPKWAMVDELATLNLQAVSDRLWIEHTGHRTPIGGLGTFWDDKKASSGEVIDLNSIM